MSCPCLFNLVYKINLSFLGSRERCSDYRLSAVMHLFYSPPLPSSNISTSTIFSCLRFLPYIRFYNRTYVVFPLALSVYIYYTENVELNGFLPSIVDLCLFHSISFPVNAWASERMEHPSLIKFPHSLHKTYTLTVSDPSYRSIHSTRPW